MEAYSEDNGGRGEKRYRKAARRFWLSWFGLMILALERWKEEDQGKHWTLSKREANIMSMRPCRKQLVPDQQYCALLCSFVYHLQSSTYPPSSPSLPHNILCPNYAMFKPVTPRGCPGPTGIPFNECCPLLLSLGRQTGTASSVSECPCPKMLIVIPDVESRSHAFGACSLYWMVHRCAFRRRQVRRKVCA